MVTGLFGSILDELSAALKIAKLEPDKNNTCLLRFANGLEVYLEMDKAEKNLVICTSVGQLPMGKYRENLCKAALAANALPYPRFGTFAFSEQANSLVLFEQFPSNNLHGDKVAEFLAPHVEKANAWRESIKRNEVPIITPPAAKGVPSGLLGLR